MKNRYEVFIYWSDEDKAFIAEAPDLPGCAADGETRLEALTNAEVIIEEWIETARELKRAIPKPQSRLLTIAEAAKSLSLSVPMVRRYCAEGRLPATKIGRDWAIRQRDVESFKLIMRQRGRPSEQLAIVR